MIDGCATSAAVNGTSAEHAERRRPERVSISCQLIVSFLGFPGRTRNLLRRARRKGKKREKKRNKEGKRWEKEGREGKRAERGQKMDEWEAPTTPFSLSLPLALLRLTPSPSRSLPRNPFPRVSLSLSIPLFLPPVPSHPLTYCLSLFPCCLLFPPSSPSPLSLPLSPVPLYLDLREREREVGRGREGEWYVRPTISSPPSLLTPSPSDIVVLFSSPPPSISPLPLSHSL